MPILTGSIDDVTGSPLPDRVPLSSLRVTVRAPSRRSSLTDQARLVASVPVPVAISQTGQISVELEPGPAVMIVEGEGLRDVYELGVTEDMTLLTEAVAEVAPNRTWVESQLILLRQAASAAAQAAQAAYDDVVASAAATAEAVAAAEGRIAVERGHVEASAEHVDSVAAQLPALLEQANVFAQDQVPPYLQQAVLNDTYAERANYVTAERAGFARLPVNELKIAPAAAPQVTPTYDGSGQAVHPDVLYFPNGWNGYRYWMAMTPYPNGDASVENPSILVSQDGDNWIVPPGLTNPIASLTPPLFFPDPDLTMVGDRMYCVWLGHYVSWSDDGINWSYRSLLINTDYTEVSPAIVREGDRFRMWTVRNESGTSKLWHRWGTGLESPSQWASPTVGTLSTPTGKKPWHIDVTRVADMYLAAIAYCDVGTSGANSILYLATSYDGLTWERSTEPVLSGRPGQWDATNIYRATLVPSTGAGGIVADMWYSARSAAGEWHIGRTAVTWRDSKVALREEVLVRAPLAELSRHTDTVEVRGAGRNRIPNPTLLRPGTATLPFGLTSWAATATSYMFSPEREAFQFSIATPVTGVEHMDFRDGLPAVTPGERWTYSVEQACSPGGRKTQVRLIWFDAAGTGISAVVVDDTLPTDGSFKRIVASGIAPANAASMWCQMRVVPGEAAATYYWRRPQLEKGTVTPWTPGPGVRAVVTPGVAPVEVHGPITTTGQKLLTGVTEHGAQLLANYTTATRPPAAQVGKGGVIFDSTLNLPIVSTGAGWVNFAGTAV